MILTTTQQIEGHTIREYKAPIKREKSDARIGSSERKEVRPKVKGVVTGETIIGANFVKDFFAGIRDIVGGRSSSSCLGKRPEVERREGAARSKGGRCRDVDNIVEGDPMKEMMERAQAMGARSSSARLLPTGRKNAIVGIDIDYETIGETNSMLMVATSGTAVVI